MADNQLTGQLPNSIGSLSALNKLCVLARLRTCRRLATYCPCRDRGGPSLLLHRALDECVGVGDVLLSFSCRVHGRVMGTARSTSAEFYACMRVCRTCANAGWDWGTVACRVSDDNRLSGTLPRSLASLNALTELCVACLWSPCETPQLAGGRAARREHARIDLVAAAHGEASRLLAS